MRDTLPLLEQIPFPAIRRGRLDTLQINVGYRCNQSCVHCHVGASPHRTEEMSGEVADIGAGVPGAPAHRDARHHRRRARAQSAFPAPGDARARDMGVRVMDRCNLTILEVAGPGGPRRNSSRGEQVEIVASMPCYLEDNVDRQRGKGVFDASIRGLQRLNALGYGRDGSGLVLNLVYNPQGPSLPPPQAALEADYKRVLGDDYGIVFNQLFTLANMPIQRFGSMLISKGEFDALSRPAAARASRRQSRRRDVPQPDLGRLARLRLRLRLQPDARPAAGAWRRASACICPTCSTPTSTATRSASPAIASAAPPARDRAAAAR